MSELAPHVLPLAIGSAVSPILLTVVLLILGGRHARARAFVFVLGAAVLLIAIAAICLPLFARGSALAGHGHEQRSGVIDTALGVLLLAYGLFRIFKPRPPHVDKRRASEAPPALALGRFFSLGVGMMAINASTLALYIAALKETARADVSDPAQLATTAGLIVFATLPALVPLIGYLTAPGPAARALGKLNALIERHSHAIGLGVCFVFGVYLVVKGAVELVA